ncbi:unnamed protein product [Prorocentrum cordatum]|uniref:Uncharacterized protein n=1 Tax=Prorocentrum cordatum TaxID=2364126 RepID=A0ABN9U314_9DINO|nr:unnamed protein product [Polarella glacialis]
MTARAGALDSVPGAARACLGEPRRKRAARSAARRRALEAADKGVKAALADAAALRSELEAVRRCFASYVGDAELADRPEAIAPALTALLRGVAPEQEVAVRRGVALHADAPGVRVASARGLTLRRPQRPARLEARRERKIECHVEICEAEALPQLGRVEALRAALRSAARPFAPAGGGPVAGGGGAQVMQAQIDVDECGEAQQQLNMGFGLAGRARVGRGARIGDCYVPSPLSPGASEVDCEVDFAQAAGALAAPPRAAGECADSDGAIFDGEADVATSCSVGEQPAAEPAGRVAAAAAAAYLDAFPQALFRGGGGARARGEVAARDWWRARAAVARALPTADSAAAQAPSDEGASVGGAAGGAPLPPGLESRSGWSSVGGAHCETSFPCVFGMPSE